MDNVDFLGYLPGTVLDPNPVKAKYLSEILELLQKESVEFLRGVRDQLQIEIG